jgi:uncharacterized membrane protein
MPTIVKYILIFFVSMVPIIELRGAVPIGIAWGLNEYVTLAICIVGNMVPVPFIYLFARKILEWGSKLKHGSGLFKWILQKGEKAGKKLTANSKKSGAFIALMLFVGIPLPGTGAWTGTLAASMLDFNPKKTSIAVMCGVLMAGTIMFVISLLAKVGITSIFDLFH